MSEENKTNENWNVADENGDIFIPDELDELTSKVFMQIRFHTISGKNETQTVVDIVYGAQKFFKERENELRAEIARLKEFLRTDGEISALEHFKN